MFDVLIFFSFATLIVRFSKALKKTEDNIDRTAEYAEKTQHLFLELNRKG